MQPELRAVQPPPAASSFPGAGVVVLFSTGVALIIIGGWVLYGGRTGRAGSASSNRTRPDENPDSAAPARFALLAAKRDALTVPTRIVVALAALVMGYHGIAWALPPHLLTARVPVERWWMLLLGVAACVVGSWAMDRMEKREAGRS